MSDMEDYLQSLEQLTKEAKEKTERYRASCEVHDADKSYQEKLQGVFDKKELAYQVDLPMLKAAVKFFEEYDISYSPDSLEWTSGTEILTHWRMTPRELANCRLDLRIFLWNKVREKMENITTRVARHDDIKRFQDHTESWFKNHPDKERPDIWFAFPGFWWFQRADVEFFEKLQYEKSLDSNQSTLIPRIAEIEPSLKWLSPREVQGRWKDMKEHRLVDLVLDKDIPVYRLSSDEGITRASISRSSFFGGSPLSGCLFQLGDIKAFECSEAKKKKGDRVLKFHASWFPKLWARDMVKVWVREDPDLRPGKAVERLVKEGFFSHTARNQTIRDAIKGLFVKPRSGPNKKQK